MEKLLKLLNEYVGEEYLYAEIDIQDGIRDNFFHDKEGEHTIEESYVISKKFGFIKWLVEKDKIDFEKICHTEFYNSFEGIISFSNVKMLLMYLAISDNPIQDLIDLLKEDDEDFDKAEVVEEFFKS